MNRDEYFNSITRVNESGSPRREVEYRVVLIEALRIFTPIPTLKFINQNGYDFVEVEFHTMVNDHNFVDIGDWHHDVLVRGGNKMISVESDVRECMSGGSPVLMSRVYPLHKPLTRIVSGAGYDINFEIIRFMNRQHESKYVNIDGVRFWVVFRL